MYYQISSYIKFLFRSSNQHGVHSPFVYDLITKCFYDKTSFSEYKTLKKYRETLLQDHGMIEVTDFGQGSRVFKSNLRKISSIAKNAGISTKRQQLLIRLMRYLGIESALELGSSLGLASSALSLGNPSANITTVEGCINTSKKATELFKAFNLKNIRLINTTFEDYFEQFHSEEHQLVYVDGNHNKERTLSYFEMLLKSTNNDSIIIFDDINWSSEMNEAWQIILSHPEVSVSIDTYFWGIVFFRKEQPKQHFTIRL